MKLLPMPFTFIVSRYLNLRTLALLFLYSLVMAVGYFGAYVLHFDFDISHYQISIWSQTVLWIVGLKLIMLFVFGQFNTVLSYFRLLDALHLFIILLVPTFILFVLRYLEYDNSPSKGVIVIDHLLTFLGLCGVRALRRMINNRGIKGLAVGYDNNRVLIVGAGEVGAGLCADLRNKSYLGMRPVAFVDDNPRKIGRYVHGLLVADSVDGMVKVAHNYAATKIIIAFPSASVKRVREVTEIARSADLAVDTVPSVGDLVSGRAKITHMRPIGLEDLLGRDPIDLKSENIRKMLHGKRVLVTGAGGSIGSELVSQVMSYQPETLVCVDQAELAIFNLTQDILSTQLEQNINVKTLVLDIHDAAALEQIFHEFRPEVIFHAAAHKHVNLMENQPAEALKNNFYATAGLALAASKYNVERFIQISTDKAINPTSVMGASKRLAELSLQEQQQQEGNTTKFIAVRFGNVLGSSGSVIPIFKRQIAAGGPITVTDPEVTRFFMTVKEAVGLVLQSATQGSGGEIFVLDMGKPVKIVDVARQMIKLSGLREGEDIDIVFSGLKPGEKLYEELQHLSEELSSTEHASIMRFISTNSATESIETIQAILDKACASGNVLEIKAAIKHIIPEYQPYF